MFFPKSFSFTQLYFGLALENVNVIQWAANLFVDLCGPAGKFQWRCKLLWFVNLILVAAGLFVLSCPWWTLQKWATLWLCSHLEDWSCCLNYLLIDLHKWQSFMAILKFSGNAFLCCRRKSVYPMGFSKPNCNPLSLMYKSMLYVLNLHLAACSVVGWHL